MLVVSRGDEQFVRLEGHRGWHFPRHEDGRWGGYHPADSREAIKHLEELRSKGAQYLVFPETSLWWLDHYGDFREHLESRYRALEKSEECLIYDVSSRRGAGLERDRASGARETGRFSPMPEAEYRELIEQVRSVASDAIPAGSTALVASNGDEALLSLGGVRGWHFPRADDGEYRDDYPEDDEELISHLEEQRSNGAQYLLFPSSELWLLDHYPSLAVHLRTEYSTVHRDDACLIFGLLERPVSAVVDWLLPPEGRVAVVTPGGDGLAGLARERTVQLRPGPDDAATVADLEQLLVQGIEFVVIPHSAFAWLEERPILRQHLRERHRFVTRQQHLCEIYELSGNG